jgi:hypothetical protein
MTRPGDYIGFFDNHVTATATAVVTKAAVVQSE